MFLLWQSNQVLASFSFFPLEFRSILRSFSYFLVSTKQLFWAGVCVRPQRLESAADDVLAGSYQRKERARADWLFPLRGLLRRRVISFRACFGNSPAYLFMEMLNSVRNFNFWKFLLLSKCLKTWKIEPKEIRTFLLKYSGGPIIWGLSQSLNSLPLHVLEPADLASERSFRLRYSQPRGCAWLCWVLAKDVFSFACVTFFNFWWMLNFEIVNKSFQFVFIPIKYLSTNCVTVSRL